MLVSGSMQNNVDLLGTHQHVDEGRVTDRAEDRNDIEIGDKGPQFALDLEEHMLAVIHQDQRLGVAARQLPAQFGSDRSTRPGDKDASPRIDIAVAGQIILDRLAPEKRRGIDRAAFERGVCTAGHEIREGGQHVHVATRLLQTPGEAVTLPVRGARHGEDDPVNIVRCRQHVDIARGMHPQPGDRQRLQVRIIVDEGHGPDSGIGRERRGKLPPGAPGTVDEYVDPWLTRCVCALRKPARALDPRQ